MLRLCVGACSSFATIFLVLLSSNRYWLDSFGEFLLFFASLPQLLSFALSAYPLGLHEGPIPLSRFSCSHSLLFTGVVLDTDSCGTCVLADATGPVGVVVFGPILAI